MVSTKESTMETPCPIRTTSAVEEPLTTLSATSSTKRFPSGPNAATQAPRPSGTFVPSDIRCSCARPTRLEAQAQTSSTTATTSATSSTAPWRIPDPDAAASIGFAPTAAAPSKETSSWEVRRNSNGRKPKLTHERARQGVKTFALDCLHPRTRVLSLAKANQLLMLTMQLCLLGSQGSLENGNRLFRLFGLFLGSLATTCKARRYSEKKTKR